MPTYERPIILNCWSSNAEYNAGCDVAVVDVTDELVQLVNERHGLFQQLAEGRTDAFAAQFWDHTPDFFSLEREPGGFERTVQSLLPSKPPLSIPEERRQPLDSCWMEISHFGVTWKAIPQNAPLQLATAEVEMSVFQELASEQSPEIGR